MAKPESTAPVTPTPTSEAAPKKAGRVQVFNNWNQIVNIVLSNGTERQLNGKTFVDLEAGDVSQLMLTLQTRGIIRIKELP
jgi:hypothetical protein